MKSYDEIEKAYADMVADSKISDRLRTLLKEKRARMEQVQKEQIYGYKVNDKNLLVVDDLPAENVKIYLLQDRGIYTESSGRTGNRGNGTP